VLKYLSEALNFMVIGPEISAPLDGVLIVAFVGCVLSKSILCLLSVSPMG
jgi:hypothetical protein